MEAFEALYSRRSVREFTRDCVEPSLIENVLMAAQAAPVGRAKYDSLRLTVIADRDFIERWENACGEGSHPFYGAPYVVLVSSILGDDDDAKNVNFSNAAIIVENMAIAATSLGLGSCLIWGAVRTLKASPDLRFELGLPEDMVPCCALAVGRFDGQPRMRQVERRIEVTYK